MTIQACVGWAQTNIASAVTKLQAPAYPTDERIAAPTIVGYSTNIRSVSNASWNQLLWDMKLDLMIPRGEMTETMTWLAGVPESIIAVFTGSPTLGGNASTFDTVTANFTAGSVGGIDCVGYTFTVSDIKIQV